MNVLLDTNILLRAAQISSPDHEKAKTAILAMAKCGMTLCLVPQIIYEYWVVATRPAKVNGLEMEVQTVGAAIDLMTREFQLLRDERGIFQHWHELVINYSVKGKTAHDARLVAAMVRHELKHIVTFNRDDFLRFTDIHVMTPDEILAGKIPV